MKKNNISRKNLHFYYYDFLPKVEAILTLKKMHDDDLVITQMSLANWLNVSKNLISDCFRQAEADGLILLDKRTTKFDDKKLAWGINKYIMPASEDPLCYSKLQEYVNEYMDWHLDFGERIDFMHDFMSTVNKQNVDVKNKSKEEKSKIYFEQNLWTKDTMDKINATRPEHLKSSYLAEGKLRENNFLCQTLNPEKEHRMKLLATDLQYRYNVLSEYFGTDDFIECDTNASIYRLSYNLCHTTLLAHNIDIYEEFWKLTGFNVEFDKKIREHLKVLCMPIFMSNGSKNGYNALLTVKDPMSLSRSEDNRRLVLLDLMKKTGVSAREILDKLTEAMYKFIGTDHFLEAEIFIHESNLHLLILDKCTDLGIKTINVYDGFYFKKSDMTQAKYHKLYDEATKKLLKKAV